MPLLPQIRPLTDQAPTDSTQLLAHAVSLQSAGKFQEAKSILEDLVVIHPARFDVITLLGIVTAQSEDYEQALRVLDVSLRVNPDQAEARNARGVCLVKLERAEAAIESFEQALALGFLEAHTNLGTTLTNLGRYEAALDHYQKALQGAPADPKLYHSQALPLLALRRFDEALASLDHAIDLNPAFAECYYLKALAHLMLGDFTTGWDLFEWRWRMPEARTDVRRLRVPLWLGDRVIEGKTILLHAEQGFGDTFQFCRFVPHVIALGAKVILEVPPALTELMASLHPDIEIIARGAHLPRFDLHCPLMSLAKALDLQPNRIPRAPFYLQPDPQRVAKWKVRLGPRKRPRVGLIWFGSMRGGAANLKSMAFEDMLILADTDADFFALQKQQAPGDELLYQRSDRITDLGPELADFADTAAAMSCLDLIVSVDTGPAHLACALGRPTWIVLMSQPEWRWPDSHTTPWYPSARLFRQTIANDWTQPLAAVKAGIQRWLSGDLELPGPER
jgi:tetratricopeptide (TPR) repeat protein